MINITKDIKNDITTVVDYRKIDGEIVPFQVTVTKKKVKTAKGDFESTKVVAKPEYIDPSTVAYLLNVLEAVG